MVLSQRWKDIINITIIIFGIMLLILLFGYMASADIGIEVINSTTIKAWNEGSIEPITYYSRSGQMWNADESRKTWTTYEAGGFVLLSTPFALDFSSASWGYFNNSKEYVVWWYIEERQGSKTIGINHTRSQREYDDYVNLTSTITLVRGWNAWTNPIYVYWGMRNTDVYNDGVADVINTVNYSSMVTTRLNESPEVYNNITAGYFTIGDANGSGIRFKFVNEEDTDFIGWHNVGFDGFAEKYSGSFNDGDILRFTHYWIDIDPCVLSASGGVWSINHNDTDTNILTFNQTDTWENNCRAICGGIFGNCFTNDKCSLQLVSNTTGGTPAVKKYITIQEEDYYNVTNFISDKTYSQIPNTVSVGSYHEIKPTLQFIASGENTIRCYVTTLANASFNNGDVNLYTVPRRRNVNASLYLNTSLNSPVNGSVFTSDDTIILTGNTTELYSWTGWMALYVNNSLYINVSSDRHNRSTWYINISETINNLTQNGVYEWDVYACTPYNECGWSYNGNWSFTFEYIKSLLPPFLDHGNDPEPYQYLSIFGVALGSILIYWIVRRRRIRRGDLLV